MFDTASTYIRDEAIFAKHNLPVFRDIPTHKEHHVGTIEGEGCLIDVYVDPMPAQFWRFEVQTSVEEPKTFEISTGSGCLADFLPSVLLVAQSMLSVKQKTTKDAELLLAREVVKAAKTYRDNNDDQRGDWENLLSLLNQYDSALGGWGEEPAIAFAQPLVSPALPKTESLRVAELVLEEVHRHLQDWAVEADAALDRHVEVFDNCREQGLVITSTLATENKHIAFAQHKNSDQIVVYVYNKTAFPSNLPHENQECWVHPNFFPSGDFAGAGKFIADLIKEDKK